MNTDWLYTFRLVVRLGSFTKAGERLFMSQPGVSAHVRQLEQFFGTELLVRKGGQIEPTPAGSAILELAEKFEELLADARNRLAGDEGPTQPLIIGSSPTPATYVLPSLIAHYRKGLPGALVQVLSMTVAEAKDRLTAGEIDFGVLSTGLLNDDLAAEPLIKTKLWLIAPPSHPLASCPSPLPEMIAQFPFLLLGAGMESHRLVKMWALDHSVSLNAVMESNSHDGLGQAVQLGLGLAFAGGPQIVQDIRDGRLVALNAPDTPLELSLYLAHRKDVHSPAKARFLSCYREAKWRLDTPAFL